MKKKKDDFQLSAAKFFGEFEVKEGGGGGSKYCVQNLLGYLAKFVFDGPKPYLITLYQKVASLSFKIVLT